MTFFDDLKLSLPKIGFVDTKEDFDAFMKAGRELADLHLNYENAEPSKDVKVRCSVPLEDLYKDDKMCRVVKMKVMKDEGKIIYNEYVTIEDIPQKAFQYIVNGRSALEWIADQYQYSKDKDSGIINDPNEYAGGHYILRLLLSLVTVSMRTREIVERLPKLNFDDKKE